jgi:hypothetical protein
MKIGRLVGLILWVTFFAVLYVWQQTEIFRLGYLVQRELSSFHELLDKNSNLRYNLNKRTSLTHIDSKVSGYGDFQVPGSYLLVKVPRDEDERGEQTASSGPLGVITGLFSIKRQAEAKTINAPREVPGLPFGDERGFRYNGREPRTSTRGVSTP